MSKATCATSGCDRSIQARGMCTTHWSQWYRANRKRPRTCEWCGEIFQTAITEAKFCSRSCAGKNASSKVTDSPGWAEYQKRVQDNKTPPRPTLTLEERQAVWRAQRSPLRAAYEDASWAAFLTHLKERCTVTADGCWEWLGRRSQGSKGGSPYPVQKWSGKQYQVHRLALEAKHGAPLGSQQAHHMCANTLCVNPDHLEPATHVENIAEMKARTSYESRIRELEAALESLDPQHELLSRVRYGT